MEFFAWLEFSSFASWIREADTVFAYDFFLFSHAVGMACIVGLNAAVDLRILGFAPRVPLAPMEKFIPLMYWGFWVNAASGVLLFIAYPQQAVTNPVFYIKLGSIALAVVCLRRIRRQVFGNPECLDTKPVPMNGKILAGTSLLLWTGAISTGRVMAYHPAGQGIEWKTLLALLIVTVVLLLAWFIAARVLGWNGRLRQVRLRQGV